jgi:hypothetical protein
MVEKAFAMAQTRMERYRRRRNRARYKKAAKRGVLAGLLSHAALMALPFAVGLAALFAVDSAIAYEAEYSPVDAIAYEPMEAETDIGSIIERWVLEPAPTVLDPATALPVLVEPAPETESELELVPNIPARTRTGYVEALPTVSVEISATPVTSQPTVAPATAAPSPPPPAPVERAATSISASCTEEANFTVTASGGGLVTVYAGGHSASGYGSASVSFTAYSFNASASADGQVDLNWGASSFGQCS